MRSYKLKQIRKWHKEYKDWTSPEGKELNVVLDLDEIRVQHFRNLNRACGEAGNWPGCYYDKYASFWVWKGGEEEISEVVRQLKEQYRDVKKKEPELNRQYASFLKCFVGSFSYQYDDRSIGHLEYGKFPIELLYDGEGDCECLSFLLCSIFVYAGFQTSILTGYTKPGKRELHVATGIILPPMKGDDVIEHNGNKYLYCEAVSNDSIGCCAFDFSIFKRDAQVIPIDEKYQWNGLPSVWKCPNGCGVIKPWIEKCNSCGHTSVFTDKQKAGDTAISWEETLTRFLDYLKWIYKASTNELYVEIEKLSRSNIWNHIPAGNRNYFEKTLEVAKEDLLDKTDRYLNGARKHLQSAWPHIVAAIFCHKPTKLIKERIVTPYMSWLGMSVYDMNNKTLVNFSRKILSDTTCKRIKGFSGGSRLAIGRILSAYERKGDKYLSEKRKSIENILVKVVIPQVFTLLAREQKNNSVLAKGVKENDNSH